MLHGRTTECETLDGLLAAAGEGRGSVLVVRGEAGIGKSALLAYAVDAASGFRVARVVGVEAEMELPFAALHQLCGRIADRMEGLPVPQADAIGVAFGLRAGEPPDRYLVGLAALSLISAMTEDHPLLWVVDDAHRLDEASAQTLAFVARRLGTESVALLFAEREPPGDDALAGLPELVVSALPDPDASELLVSAVPGRLDEEVRDRIVVEARGNPLALVEATRGLSPADFAGGFTPAGRTVPPAGRIDDGVRTRLAALPAQTRLVLLLAAADPVGDPELLWRAAPRLGIRTHHAAPAEAAGLIHIGDRVTFRDPLVRSAVYGAASLHDRQRVHRVLAKATDTRTDADRRAWHRAQATHAPDESVARELERRADRARDRGGLAAAAAFLAKATALTPDGARRARRGLAAARATHRAGAPAAALQLAAVADTGPLAELDRAQLQRLRALIDFHLRRGRDVQQRLLDAAERLAPLDVGAARETYLEAFEAAAFSGRFSGEGELRRTLVSARDARPAPHPSRAVDVLLDGLTTMCTVGQEAGSASVRRALAAFRNQHDLTGMWLACHTAMALWDDETGRALAGRHIQLARDAGDLTVLPLGLNTMAALLVDSGDLTTASALVDEADAVTAATGNAPVRHAAMLLAAWRGRRDRATELIDACVRDASSRGDALTIAGAELALAVLHNSLLDSRTALRAAQQAADNDELGFGRWVLPELVEAARRSGHDDQAIAALDRLTDHARASGTEWALGIAASSRALVLDGNEAEEAHDEAVDRLSRTRTRLHYARAHLSYGEWLRRRRRRADAREHLRAAYDVFAASGAEAFAQRACRELVATGERVRQRTAATHHELTGQEALIAGLASEGFSNPEIAAQLFISRRTVEYHLHKVFTKLDITTRHLLPSVLAHRRGPGPDG